MVTPGTRWSRWLGALALLAAACATPPASRPLASSSPSPSVSVPDLVPIEDPGCERVEFSSIRSVIVIPSEVVTRVMAPVVHAACACSRSGDNIKLRVVMVPELGAVKATAFDDARVDACIQHSLDGRFTPFRLGSDCVDCGSHHDGILRPPPEPRPSHVIYPFTLVHR